MMRILCLILASDSPIYTPLQENWRSYIYRYSDTIEAYFYKANPKLEVPWKLEGDTLWVNCPENLHSVAKKFQLALRAFESRFNEFDFILRPNLSSVFMMDRYLEAVKTLPKEGACMAKRHTHPAIFPTGAGFTISIDIARAILQSEFKQRVYGGDDVALGDLLQSMKIPIRDVPRVDITNTSAHDKQIQQIFDDPRIFHLRVKHEGADRLQKDMSVHRRVLKHFYGIEFPEQS